MQSEQIFDVLGVLLSRVDMLRIRVGLESIAKPLGGFNVLLVENLASEVVGSNRFQAAVNSKISIDKLIENNKR